MKYVLGVLGILLVVFLAIVLVRSGGRDRPPAERPVAVSEQNREGTSVQLTEQGRLVGEDQRRAIRIVVTQNERRLEILTGYEEAVEKSQVYPNTPAAYETFLIALDRAGLNRPRRTAVTDERGVCPLGQRYIFEVKEYSQELVRLWSTSCGNDEGTFAGKGSTIRTLFKAQIPDYATQTRTVKL